MGGSWFIKRYLSLEDMRRKQEQDEFYDKIKNEINKKHDSSKHDDEALHSEVNGLSVVLGSLKRGLLSVQGRQFKSDCKKLLASEHVMSIEEYQQINEDHQAYHALGGNHNGDALFDLVKKKAEKEIGINISETE